MSKSAEILQERNEHWEKTGFNYLTRDLIRIQTLLERKIAENSENSEPMVEEVAVTIPGTPLSILCQGLQLTNFERDLLLLCLGVELDPYWCHLLAQAQGETTLNYPTFSLALALFADAHWSALTPQRPLRRWAVLEIGAGRTLTLSPLRINENILHFLCGSSQIDDRLQGLIEPLPALSHLVPSHEAIAQQIVTTWLTHNRISKALPLIQLCGEDVVSKRAIALFAARAVQTNLKVIPLETLPLESAQLQLFQTLWEREWYLRNTVLLLDCDLQETRDHNRESILARFIELIDCPLIIATRDRRLPRQRPVITFEVPPPTISEQMWLWENHLHPMTPQLNGHLDNLVSHFSMSPSAIESACLQVRSQQPPETETSATNLHHQLWQICRIQARPRLDELAQRIDIAADWDDLILPDKERLVLQEIAIHLRHKHQIYEQWGFGNKSKRGLGISALFAGQSGTGKTMAAEILGKNLNLDVYRIDLSSIVSKYIGETEKNLRRVFDAAEGGGTILLFDEADALFGKRSEVKDSHDRYANMEVSYLLQRMEAYRGLAILTTNIKSGIDQAFLRRLRFVVQFPFPDAHQREEIWRRVFPSQTPTQGLDYQKLASLHVAGGNIRNIAMNAAFLAAEALEPVMMKHLLQAAKSEYVKLERPMSDSEVRGWV